MAPSEISQKVGYLEYPNETFDYFRKQGVDKVICEEKHMGSRMIAIVCRDATIAKQRFHVTDGLAGICYTRTGRPFFNDLELEQQLLNRVRTALDTAGLWDALDTDWVILDCELLPWSAKAQALLEQQYAPVASAAENALSVVAKLLSQTAQRITEAQALTDDFNDRLAMVKKYRKACRRIAGQ